MLVSRTLGDGFEGLYMCRIDLLNCFLSLSLPVRNNDCFRILRDLGRVRSFCCLPFGWKYSPIFYQKVMEDLVASRG